MLPILEIRSFTNTLTHMELVHLDLSLIQQIFDHQPEATVLVHPVWGQEEISGANRIVDFQFSYCNDAIQGLNGKTKEELLGKLVLQDKLPDPGISETIFTQCLEVYNSGEPLEYSYFSSVLEKYVTLKRVKLLDGVLTTARNRTDEYKVQIEKEQQSKLLQNLIENSPYGISLYKSIRNETGAIVDFHLRLCNNKSAEYAALSLEELRNSTVKQLMALRSHTSYFFDVCVSVVETGEPKYLEYYSKITGKWLAFSIVKFEDGYLLNYIDISETKRFEEEAKRQANELDTIFNGSLNGIYTVKAVRDSKNEVVDLTFIRANEAFYKMFSTSEKKIIRSSLLSLSQGDDQSEFLQFARDVLTTGSPSTHTLKYENPERWFAFSMVKLEEETLSVTVIDITRERLSVAEIEKQKNLLDNILRQSPNGIAITKAISDGQGVMVDAISVLMNEACEKLNGVPNEVSLTNTVGALDPNILSSPLFESAKSLSIGESFRTEYFLPLTNRWLELAVAKMDKNHFINVFTDISAVKEAQLQLQRTVDDLKKLNANLEDFAYAASHDMKEPIRKIHFFADKLKGELSDQLSDKQKQLFGRLEHAAKRMGLLIDDLLAYSHTTKGLTNIEAVDLNQKLQNVLIDLELEVEQKKAHIKASGLPIINGNRRQLQQLFQNLISNALKYGTPGVHPEIVITSSKIKGGDVKDKVHPSEASRVFYLLEFRDNSIGFNQEDAERIFNVFTRLHGSKDYIGSGVGLSIVKKVVENHSGYIWAESEIGKGATFKVLLPA